MLEHKTIRELAVSDLAACRAVADCEREAKRRGIPVPATVDRAANLTVAAPEDPEATTDTPEGGASGSSGRVPPALFDAQS